jgi:pyridoxamine 5'-phosphate oxidase
VADTAPWSEPFRRFAEVYAEAVATGMRDPNAMVLSTRDTREEGGPDSRVVLLKGHDESGFVFYTNLESAKGEQIAAHPEVALIFYWRDLEKQVRIQGRAEPVSEEEADAYFATRPRQSQVGAWASQQSREMPSRAHFLAALAKVEAKYLGRKVPRPPHWSGFRVVPRKIEFWHAQPFRLHFRTVFSRVGQAGEGWRVTELYP